MKKQKTILKAGNKKRTNNHNDKKKGKRVMHSECKDKNVPNQIQNYTKKIIPYYIFNIGKKRGKKKNQNPQ